MTYGDSSKKHRVVGSFTTNTSVPGHESWDLRPYKTAGIGKPGGTWRLIEVGYNLLYAEGKIAADGTLVSYDYVELTAPTRSETESGLDDTFYSHYSYDGYMELQVFDPDAQLNSSRNPIPTRRYGFRLFSFYSAIHCWTCA